MPRKKGAASAEASAPAASAPAKAQEPAPAPEPIQEAAPEPKAKAKAKAKAEGPAPKAKAKAEPKGKAQEEPKAEAKAEPKAKAKAKADSKSEAPAPKAKAKGKAKAESAPAPAPEPEDDGMEQVKSKKKKNNKKKAEEEAPKVVEEPKLGITEEEERDKARFKTAHDKKHQGLASEMRKELSSLPALGKASDVMKEVAEQRKAVEGLISRIDDTLKTVKVVRPKNINTAKIMESIREMRLCKDDGDGILSKETKKDMIDDYQQALSKSLAWESFRNFQAEMTVLREECESHLKKNEETAKELRSQSGAKKLQQRVATAKGVKPEELGEVVSINVDVSAEVGSALFVFQRSYEKQFGVVIDRPDAAKGAGKGGKGDAKGQPPPKDLIVRGVEADASACAKAIKAIDMSSKQAIAVTSRQAAAIMGQQQANARKIEEEFKGVFVSSEKGEVRLFGPKKVVVECEKHIRTVMAEVDAGPVTEGGEASGKAAGKGKAAGSSLSATIDADKARALIGIGGKNIQKLEGDTETRIKVNIPPKGEGNEDNKATFRVSGEPANAQKGLDKVKEFVERLQVMLVEGESDAVSRLYDSTVSRKGKGKGRGGPKVEGSEKFAELRESSGLTVVRKPKGVLLVGERAEVFKWKSVLATCIEQAGVVPEPPYSDTMEDISKDGLRLLTARGAAKLKEIEQKHDVSIGIDRKTSVVKITGSEDKVDEAKKAVLAATTIAAGETKEFEIEWDDGRVIIGRGGSTVRHIKEQSGVDDLQIKDGEENKKVILRGSEEAIAKAETLIEETLAEAKKAREEGSGAAEAAAPKKETRAKKEKVAEEDGQVATKKPPQKAKPAPVKPELDSQELFPTLGGGGAAAAPKRGAWGDKKEGAKETEAEAPEAFPTLGDSKDEA